MFKLQNEFKKIGLRIDLKDDEMQIHGGAGRVHDHLWPSCSPQMEHEIINDLLLYSAVTAMLKWAL